MSQISMKKDLWCHFDYEGHNIAVHFSNWSGKEVVYVDDHPVSEKRNFLMFTSRHDIQIKGKPLIVELESLSFSVEVSLKKGARALQKQTVRPFGTNKNMLVVMLGSLVGLMIIGGLTGYLTGKMLVG